MGITHNEWLELNYAKALLSYKKKEYTKALDHLRKNISKKNYHRPSYELIADIYNKKGLTLKEIRTLYHILKREGHNEILTARGKEELESLKNRPQIEDLALIKRIANLYSTHYQDKKRQYKRSGNDQFARYQRLLKLIYSHANKYYHFCLLRKYNRAEVLYSMALLERSADNYIKARDLFFDSKDAIADRLDEDIIQDTMIDDEIELKNTVNFYIAESLLREGHTDLAIKYYKHIRNSPFNDPLKNISKVYLDNMNDSAFSFSFGYNLGSESNPETLNQEELAEINESSNGTLSEKSATLFYQSELKQSKRFGMGFNFYENTYNQEKKTLDQRVITVSGEGKFYLGQQSVWTLGTSYSKFYDKTFTPEFFDSQSQLSAQVNYSRVNLLGYLTLGSEIGRLSLSNSTQNNLSLNISNLFYAYNKYIHPTVSLSWTNNSEVVEDDLPSTTDLKFEISNQMYVSDSWSPYITFSITNTSSTDPIYASTEMRLNHTSYYSLDKFVEGLSAQGIVEYITMKAENDLSAASNFVLKAGLNIAI